MSSRRSKTYSKNPQNRELGIALISVLWVLLLLSGLAGAVSFMARTNAILTHKLGEFAQAEATADAAVVNAIGRLSDETSSRHPPIDGHAQTWEFQGVQVNVSISNEAGRIDVNTADDDLILAFLYSQGVEEGGATKMLSDLRKSQHVASGPVPSGTLRTIEELQKIPSWAAQGLDCWRDSLTVYTGSPGVRPSDATDQVEMALRWAQEHRTGNRDQTAAKVVEPTVRSDQSMLGEVIRIVASVSSTPGITANSEWIGRLTGDARQPTLTMRWAHKSIGLPVACRKS
jgi:general secretion pathway protein K